MSYVNWRILEVYFGEQLNTWKDDKLNTFIISQQLNTWKDKLNITHRDPSRIHFHFWTICIIIIHGWFDLWYQVDVWRGYKRIGSPLASLGIGLTMIFSFGITFFHLNFLTRWCMNTSISKRAYSFPGHIWGPPPNGTNVYGAGPFPSNLDGSSFCGSGKNSGFLWVEFVLQYNYIIE